MKRYTYNMPLSIDEAISLHESYSGGARYIAGGTDVMLKIKEGKVSPEALISLNRIPDMNRVILNPDTGRLHIGALATHRKLETSGIIQTGYPILHDAVKQIGSVQIRNVATIGGNLVNAVPSADGAIPLIALDAKVTIQGAKGKRELDLIHFFEGPGQTVMTSSDILTEIVIPRPNSRTGGAYVKFGRREAMELPILGVGVLISVDETAICQRARICLGVAAPTPMRALSAERFLTGKPVTDQTLAEAGSIAAEESRVRDSIRGAAWYRREMVSVLVKRMGKMCLERLSLKSGTGGG